MQLEYGCMVQNYIGTSGTLNKTIKSVIVDIESFITVQLHVALHHYYGYNIALLIAQQI